MSPALAGGFLTTAPPGMSDEAVLRVCDKAGDWNQLLLPMAIAEAPLKETASPSSVPLTCGHPLTHPYWQKKPASKADGRSAEFYHHRVWKAGFRAAILQPNDWHCHMPYPLTLATSGTGTRRQCAVLNSTWNCAWLKFWLVSY